MTRYLFAYLFVVYLKMLCHWLRLYSVEWKVIGELIGKDMEGSCCGLSLKYYTGIRLEGLRKATENFSQDSRFPHRYLKLEPPEYEAVVLTTQPRRSVRHRKTYAFAKASFK
jgi:hypothetical protein